MKTQSEHSLCDRCGNIDLATMAEINASRKDAGIPEADHIWCFVTDQPEDKRITSCTNFINYYQEER